MQEEARYQVFVSSTFGDLKDEREKVLQAILQLRAFPAGMELFPAADEEQFEFIKREIDSSDYYVVIIAGRYGSVDENGVSFTEKEYDYARSTGKPILAFVVKDMGKLIGEKLEKSEEMQERVKRFTEKAKSSKLVNFFSNPDELKSAVLVSLPSQFNLRPMRGWVRAGQTPREDLETINQLQQRVIKLEAENQELRALRDDVADRLATGSEMVRWTFSTSGLIGVPDGGSEVNVESTWDGMLLMLFPGGSSYITRQSVKAATRNLVLKAADASLTRQGEKLSQNRELVLWVDKASDAILNALHRQFTGLSLIEEKRETEYTSMMPLREPTPRSVSAWRLTQKGEKYLAMLDGQLRAEDIVSST